MGQQSTATGILGIEGQGATPCLIVAKVLDAEASAFVRVLARERGIEPEAALDLIIEVGLQRFGL